jgi:hypothetical protein
MKIRNTDFGYFLQLIKGDEVIQSLMKFAEEERIESGFFSGIGAFKDLEVAYFDTENKDYPKKYFPGVYEVLSCKGNLSITDGSPLPHCHIVFSDTHFEAHGGHLVKAIVAVTGEFQIITDDRLLTRKFDEDIGLSLWEL